MAGEVKIAPSLGEEHKAVTHSQAQEEPECPVKAHKGGQATRPINVDFVASALHFLH